MQVYLVLVDGRGVEGGVEHHGGGAVVLLVVVRGRVVVVVRGGVRGVRAPVVRVVGVVVRVARARAHHRVQVGFGRVEHRRRRC